MRPEPKSRPILFQGAMVRAILAGTKTQTRRLVKPADLVRAGENGPELWTGFMGWQPAEVVLGDQGLSTNPQTRCPYGAPGDRLWVRETWAYHLHAQAALRDEDGPWVYAADGDHVLQQRLCDRWRPSIHMPRAVSRITLEVTGVRVERLQEISEADALAEGVGSQEVPRTYGPRFAKVDRLPCVHCGRLRRDHVGSAMACFGGHGTCWNGATARGGYAWLWDQINGDGSWEANPWVWVVEFRRLP